MTPLNQWRARAEFISAGGWRIATWRPEHPSDKKPWLILIHGFPTSSWDWSGIWRDLSKKFNVAALDMLGFGLSDKPKNIRYAIDAQADLQEILLEQLGVGEAHILAHDYGDTVAQELLARQIDKSLSFSIKSVCFLNGGIFPSLHRALPVQKLGESPLGFIVSLMMSKERLKATFNQIFGPDTKPSDAEIDAHWSLISENGGARVFHKLLRYMTDRRRNADRYVDAITDSTCPLCLINGGQDPISGVHVYEHFRQIAPQAQAILLPSIGHYPQNEAPEAVLSAFMEFHQAIRTPFRETT